MDGKKGMYVYQLRTYGNRVLRKTELLGCNREELSGSSRKLYRNFVIYTPRKILY
jgi:hypothetical protein